VASIMARKVGANFENTAGGKINFGAAVLKAAKELDFAGVRLLRAVGYMARADIAAATMRSKGPRSVKLADSSPFPRSTGAGGRRAAGVPLTAHRVTTNNTLVISSIVANLYNHGRTLRDGSTESGKGILTETGQSIIDMNLQKYTDKSQKKVLVDVLKAWEGKA